MLKKFQAVGKILKLYQQIKNADFNRNRHSDFICLEEDQSGYFTPLLSRETLRNI